MTEADPRRLAFDVLVEVERRNAFADATLGRALESARLAANDRRLATRLVYGTLAWQGRLDHTIDAYARRAKIDPAVAIALRLGLFQIACLDRVPDYAAVDASVSLARKAAPHAAGFVNAVLRRTVRNGLAEPPATEPQRSAVLLSHPAWLVEAWRGELGRTEADALMRANNEPMPTVLRALGARDDAIAALQARGVEASPAPHAPDAIVVDRPVTIPGLTLPQGEASQLVALLLNASAGERVLDACAAPGGKAAYLAARVGSGGHVVAVDPAPNAADRLRKTIEHARVANVDVVAARIEEAHDLGVFDAVLVDAPCSGLGTLREHPEIRWRRRPNDVASLAGRQASALSAAARHVASGGRLVYATCTLLAAENEAVVERFLECHEDFRLDTGRDVDAAAKPFVDDSGYFRTLPHRDDMAGFFAARLVRV